MSIFNHNVANVNLEKEILEREMQKTYLEGLLELRREELEADFDNLFKAFNEKNKNGDEADLWDTLEECRESLRNFLEVKAELITTKREIEYAKDELKEIEQ